MTMLRSAIVLLKIIGTSSDSELTLQAARPLRITGRKSQILQIHSWNLRIALVAVVPMHFSTQTLVDVQ
jgi:hypothetical protein